MTPSCTRGRFAAGSAAALASIALVRGKARAADFTLKFGTTEPVESPVNVLAIKACREIQARGLYAHDRMLVIGMRQITSNLRPIQKPDDLANFKIRTPPGRLSIDLFRAFGASPVPINFSELYTSLQTHVVDGEENSLNSIYQGRFFEVQKYLSLTAHQ
jgi:TRAP-type C4-dicarboxylate transport system substrate-binding protein